MGTIHTMHAPHTKLALNAGKHVVCEKPLAVNAAEAKELVELARSKAGLGWHCTALGLASVRLSL